MATRAQDLDSIGVVPGGFRKVIKKIRVNKQDVYLLRTRSETGDSYSIVSPERFAGSKFWENLNEAAVRLRYETGSCTCSIGYCDVIKKLG